MKEFKSKTNVTIKNDKCEIIVKCCNCKKELIHYINVPIEELNNRKNTINNTIKSCLDCNLQSENSFKSICRRRSKNAAIVALSEF